MIHPSNVEPGAVYLGEDGRVREVVEMSGYLISYRPLPSGCKIGDPAFHMSRPAYIEKAEFCRWAKMELA